MTPIEPMFWPSAPTSSPSIPDGWTVRTADGSRAAHSEHTIAITEDGPEILTLPEVGAEAADRPTRPCPTRGRLVRSGGPDRQDPRAAPSLPLAGTRAGGGLCRLARRRTDVVGRLGRGPQLVQAGRAVRRRQPRPVCGRLATHTPHIEELLDIGERASTDPTTAPVTVCSTHLDGCAGDPRLDDWAGSHRIQQAVAFTNEHGARLSGHVWMVLATRARTWPRRRPLVVITTGSIQAPEQAYWWAAQVLAAHGFVVLTFDSQGQGSSSTLGDGWSTGGGVPGEPVVNFVDNTRGGPRLRRSPRRDRPYVAAAPRRPRPRIGHASQSGRGLADAVQPPLAPRRPPPARARRPLLRVPTRTATSPRSTTASTRWSPGTTSRSACPAGVDGTGIGQPRARHRSRRSDAEPFTPRGSRPWASRWTTASTAAPDRTFYPGPFLRPARPLGQAARLRAGLPRRPGRRRRDRRSGAGPALRVLLVPGQPGLHRHPAAASTWPAWYTARG